jgi:hypothetical protein
VIDFSAFFKPILGCAKRRSFYPERLRVNAKWLSLPSGKTVRVQIVSANDAGQGQPSTAAEIVVA